MRSTFLVERESRAIWYMQGLNVSAYKSPYGLEFARPVGLLWVGKRLSR
jgi:hypothetical protein